MLIPTKLLICICALLLSACEQPNQQKLIITGSSTIAPLINEIAQRYESQHDSVRIDVQTGGSSRGINDARKKLADIGMVSRDLKDSEHDLISHTVALDGITVITHQNNPISQLSNQQIIDIYTGKLENWQQVGGHDRQITVVNKAEGRSTLELFLNYFSLKNQQIQADLIIGDNQQGLKTVIGNSAAIAYVSIGAAAYEENHNQPIQRLTIGGIDATLSNVKDNTFPLSRTLNLVTLKNGSLRHKQQLVHDFIAFAQSAKVHDLIQQQFFIAIDAP